MFSTQQILELACAAQRINGTYQKDDSIPILSQNEADKHQIMYYKMGNKALIRYTLDPESQVIIGMEIYMTKLQVIPEDVALAQQIKIHFKKFMFAAIQGDNEFKTSINSFLNADTILGKNIGYIACLPSVYARDKANGEIKRIAKSVDEGFLGNPGDRLHDLDCEIIEVNKSKNFDGWNICAIINNKMASWMSQVELKCGPCVIVKAKVKDNTKHWKHHTDDTRLNYVKAAQ